MNKGSKSKIISYGFSYATLRLWKKKFRSRLAGFIKAKEFEEECFIWNITKLEDLHVW